MEGSNGESAKSVELGELGRTVDRLVRDNDEVRKQLSTLADRNQEYQVLLKSLKPELQNALGEEIRKSVGKETHDQIRTILTTLGVAATVLAGAIGFDFWKPQLLRAMHQKLFPINVDPQVAE